MREIILDTETTGLDPVDGHRIIEIGCVEVMGRIRTGRTFQTYINPQRDVPEAAFRIHGISADFLADKPLFAHKAEDLLSFIGDAQLVIHNAQFDLRFLNFELELLGLPPIDLTRATDTVLLARKLFPGSPANLDALCRRFNIDLSARTKHGALLDAELLSDVYLELTGGRQSVMSLEMVGITITPEIVTPETIQIVPRFFPPSSEELAAHAAFMQNLRNPLWLMDKASAA